MLKEMTAVISDDGTNIRGVEFKTGQGDGTEAEVDFIIEAEDVRHLGRLVAGLRKVQGVRDVQRMQRL
jgi:GTP pyrophosphokinase